MKLAGFAAALAIVFAAAALAGGAVGPVHRPARSAEKAAPGMARMPAAGEKAAPGMAGMPAAGEKAAPGMAGMPAAGEKAAPVRGLAVSDDGLTLRLARTTARPGTRFDLAFRILDRRGRTVRDFDVEHTKRMHFIVVRRDMTGFQHLHPTQRSDGTWTAPVRLRDAGSYRVFADFSVDGRPHTLAADLQLDGAVRSRPLPAAATSTTADGMKVTLTEGPASAGAESRLDFTVTRNGRPIPVQDYLGAKGHLVALREGDLAYLHVHPDEESLRFMAGFPTAGRYRLFLQFQVDGRVHTAALTQEVAR